MSLRLIAFDFDSTLAPGEVIDELAREAGAYDAVAAVTAQTMGGSLDFAEAMNQRLALLGSLCRHDVDRVVERIALRPGAPALWSELRRRDYRIAIISGGFLDVLGTVLRREQCEPDHLFANELRFDADGRLLPEAVLHVSSNKGDVLRELQEALEIPASRTVAVGDGATDIAMFREAGTSIAVHAKPIVREAATAVFDGESLDALVPLLP